MVFALLGCRPCRVGEFWHFTTSSFFQVALKSERARRHTHCCSTYNHVFWYAISWVNLWSCRWENLFIKEEAATRYELRQVINYLLPTLLSPNLPCAGRLLRKQFYFDCFNSKGLTNKSHKSSWWRDRGSLSKQVHGLSFTSWGFSLFLHWRNKWFRK